MFIKQTSGKKLRTLAKKFRNELYYHSIKYDGYYTQIFVGLNEVKLYSSSGIELNPIGLESVVRKAVKNIPQHLYPFSLEAEYLFNSEGKLGSRRLSARLTHYIGKSRNGTSYNLHHKDTFRVFDIILHYDMGMKFSDRKFILEHLIENDTIKPVKHNDMALPIDDIIHVAISAHELGHEGLMLKHPKHVHLPGKRVNELVKIKHLNTVELKCIGTKPGKGKFSNDIGSLLLVDDKGIECYVSSGLSEAERRLPPSHFIGRKFKITYEQFIYTYVQTKLLGAN